jgi:hypothetical protein
MFEPTKGCPHLQPIELMTLAEKTAVEAGHDADSDRSVVAVEITEVTPDHMFKCIKTLLKWNGSIWMVSGVERILVLEGQRFGAKMVPIT